MRRFKGWLQGTSNCMNSVINLLRILRHSLLGLLSIDLRKKPATLEYCDLWNIAAYLGLDRNPPPQTGRFRSIYIYTRENQMKTAIIFSPTF